MAKIYVGNLPFTAGGDEGGGVFLKHGPGGAGSVPAGRGTGRPPGVGFLEMSQADAQRAIGALNGYSMNGRPLRVNEAQDKPRTGGPGGGGRGPRPGGGGGFRSGGGGGGGGRW